MADKEEMLNKARERGYSVVMQSGNKNWYGLYKDGYQINLSLDVSTGEFELKHIKGILTISTGTCGSFLNDLHFNRIENAVKNVIFKLM